MGNFYDTEKLIYGIIEMGFHCVGSTWADGEYSGGIYMDTRLICFDLDDTLIRDIHSVMLPCILNGKEKEHAVIQKQEESGLLDYKTADYLRAELLSGLNEQDIKCHFLEIAKPLENIRETIDILHKHGIKCLLITVGPVQVAGVVSAIYGFDGFYGSNYEVINGKFTGKIVTYVEAENKVDCLEDYCRKNNINPSACIAVGDGSTDIPVFNYCGKSIALNASDRVKRKAVYSVDSNNLLEILDYVI